MLEEIFTKIFDEAIGKYVPQYLTGELSLEETFEKIRKEIDSKNASGEYDDILKQEIDKFTDIRELPYGDKNIYIIPCAKDKPIKVTFENPTWQLTKDTEDPLLFEYRKVLKGVRHENNSL